MNEFFLIAADYIKGKSIYPSARRAFTLLFNISISSFIYERIYGSYVWLNYNDYKGILNYFIKGDFFVPFSIFLIVYGATEFVSVILFGLLTHFPNIKLSRKILLYQLEKNSVDKGIRQITRKSRRIASIDWPKSKMIEFYHNIKQDINQELIDKIQKEMAGPKKEMEMNFIFTFRGLVAISIYFLTLNHFGWMLFALTLIVVLYAMACFVIAYRLMDLLPTLVRKFHELAEKYLYDSTT